VFCGRCFDKTPGIGFVGHCSKCNNPVQYASKNNWSETLPQRNLPASTGSTSTRRPRLSATDVSQLLGGVMSTAIDAIRVHRGSWGCRFVERDMLRLI
jgi:hypothetical protein